MLKWVRAKFGGTPAALHGNTRTLKAGYEFARAAELLPVQYRIPPATLPSGAYRHLTGNDGLTLGLQTAARLANRPLLFAAAPMTPSSELLHLLLDRPAADLRALQAE